MFKKLHYIIIISIIFSIVLAFTFSSSAQYPQRDVEVIMSYGPGGGTDILARVIFQFVGKKLGVNFPIINMPGAGSQIGYTAMALAEPDGYTIGNTNTTTNVTIELTREGVEFKLKEHVQPICQAAFDPTALFVRADSPFQTFDEVVEFLKEHPRGLSHGGTALWGAHHVTMRMVELEAGIEFNYIPFDTSPDAKAALLGGHIDVLGAGFTEASQQVDEGEVRALAIARVERFKDYPDIPTYSDYGYNVEMGASRGYAAPKGTPHEIIELLASTIKEVLVDPDFLVKAEEVGVSDIIYFRGPKEFTEFLYDLQDLLREKIIPKEELVVN